MLVVVEVMVAKFRKIKITLQLILKILNMKKLVSNKIIILGILLGGIGGFLYWKEIGCITGTCPLKSQWQTMIPYGMFIGYVVSNFIQSYLNRFESKRK